MGIAVTKNWFQIQLTTLSPQAHNMSWILIIESDHLSFTWIFYYQKENKIVKIRTLELSQMYDNVFKTWSHMKNRKFTKLHSINLVNCRLVSMRFWQSFLQRLLGLAWWWVEVQFFWSLLDGEEDGKLYQSCSVVLQRWHKKGYQVRAESVSVWLVNFLIINQAKGIGRTDCQLTLYRRLSFGRILLLCT